MTPDELKAGLEGALGHASDGRTIADVEQALLAGQAQLWRGERAAMITRLVDTEEGRTAHVWLGFGDIGELLRIQPGAEAWALGLGCRFITISGRVGWVRALKARGFRRHGPELRKAL